MISIAKPLIGIEEQNAVKRVLESGMIACGPITAEFEKQFADYIGVKHAISTTSGTTALHLGLMCIGIKPGDEVIVPSFSFIASVNPVLFCGAKPIFCDVNPITFNIDIEKIEGLISEKTKAIIPVHLYGQPADMNPITEIAQKHNLNIIGDACQAHGATYDNKMVGSFGDMECFSFYPTKNMTTSEGGMITTNSDEIATLALSIRNHGREQTKWGYEHGRIGYNYRMTDITAAIGIEQLKKLPMFIQKRRQNAKYFDEKLQGVNTPFVLDNAEHSYHQYTIKTNNRDRLIESLKQNDIGFGVYYPKPLHQYSHLTQFAHDDLKNSEQICNEILSIPVHPALNENELEKIANAINEACQQP